ncbi:10309_t:CDS:2 [Entrophospora sp. SA101]|nr:10309_t:CDS:2 [Entrophospora sp. SA101]
MDVNQLIKRGEKNITVFDVIQRYFDDDDKSEVKIKHVIGDLTNSQDVEKAIKENGITCVINTASPPHDGKNEEMFWKVNVQGTKNVIEACLANQVRKLVYTSSSSVIYDGVNELINADETYPYPDKHMDVYNETKAEGERLVIAANGKNGLLTCCLRPCGIFGPYDRQAIPALIKVMERGQTKFQIGDNTNLVDWTYVENIAYAHLLAADKLIEGNGVDGEVFIITNGTPIPFWDLPRMVWAQFNHYPSYIITLPKSFGIIIASLAELTSYLTGSTPGFTRFRIKFSTNNRYFNISKAKERLGYEPLVDLEEGIKSSLNIYLIKVIIDLMPLIRLTQGLFSGLEMNACATKI